MLFKLDNRQECNKFTFSVSAIWARENQATHVFIMYYYAYVSSHVHMDQILHKYKYFDLKNFKMQINLIFILIEYSDLNKSQIFSRQYYNIRL